MLSNVFEALEKIRDLHMFVILIMLVVSIQADLIQNL